MTYRQLKKYAKIRFKLKHEGSDYLKEDLLQAENAKSLYHELGKKTIEVNEPPPIEEVEDSWKSIC